jgi:hypothetical protein
VTGRRPTPKGYYQISEGYLSEIPIALPGRRQDVEGILRAVDRLVTETDQGTVANAERELFRIVWRLLSASAG